MEKKLYLTALRFFRMENSSVFMTKRFFQRMMSSMKVAVFGAAQSSRRGSGKEKNRRADLRRHLAACRLCRQHKDMLAILFRNAKAQN